VPVLRHSRRGAARPRVQIPAPARRLQHSRPLTLRQSDLIATAPAGYVLKGDITLVGGKGGVPRVRSHCYFRKRGTEYVSEYGINWMNGGTK
jgi:hypothetical protein